MKKQTKHYGISIKKLDKDKEFIAFGFIDAVDEKDVMQQLVDYIKDSVNVSIAELEEGK